MSSNLFQKRSFKQFGSTVLLTSLVISGLIAILRQVGVFEGMELTAYDRYMRLKPAAPTDERVLVVGVTESDIQELQEYPVEDGTLAKALEKLEANNPRAIGLDIARDIPQGPPAGRERLTTVLGNSDRIAAGCRLSDTREPGIAPPPGADLDLVGFVDFPQDIDGKIRRSILISAPEISTTAVVNTHLCNDVEADEEILSLGLTVALMYLEQEDIGFGQNNWGDLTVGDTVIPSVTQRSGGYAQREVEDYQSMVNYRAANNAVRQVSLTAVLNDEVDPSWIEDSAVLIGYTAEIANDVFLTPYKATTDDLREMPGVVVHAQSTSQILSATLDGRPLIYSWPEVIEILLIGTCAVAGGSLVLYNRRLIIFVVGCGGLIAAYWGICFLFFMQGLWLPLVPSIIAFITTAASVAVIDRAHQGGYARAIYEQLRSQLGNNDPTEIQAINQQKQQHNYLEDLVHRAKMVRQRRKGEALWESDAIAHLNDNPDDLHFESPEMQTLYNTIKTKAQQDWEDERATVEAQQAQTQQQQQAQRIQALIGKAQSVRTAHSRGTSS